MGQFVVICLLALSVGYLFLKVMEVRVLLRTVQKEMSELTVIVTEHAKDMTEQLTASSQNVQAVTDIIVGSEPVSHSGYIKSIEKVLVDSAGDMDVLTQTRVAVSMYMQRHVDTSTVLCELLRSCDRAIHACFGAQVDKSISESMQYWKKSAISLTSSVPPLVANDIDDLYDSIANLRMHHDWCSNRVQKANLALLIERYSQHVKSLTSIRRNWTKTENNEEKEK